MRRLLRPLPRTRLPSSPRRRLLSSTSGGQLRSAWGASSSSPWHKACDARGLATTLCVTLSGAGLLGSVLDGDRHRALSQQAAATTPRPRTKDVSSSSTRPSVSAPAPASAATPSTSNSTSTSASASASSPAAPSAPARRKGNVFAEYRINEELGVGAFAKVHRGWHRQSGKQFAIKMIDKPTGPFAGRDDTWKEVEMMRLAGAHPNIVVRVPPLRGRRGERVRWWCARWLWVVVVAMVEGGGWRVGR